MFEIEFLPEKQVLRWRLKGFWTEETAREFKAAVADEIRRVRRICPRFYTMSDSREFPVQTDAVMKLLQIDPRDPMVQGSLKMAIVVSTTLKQLQAQRAFSWTDRIRVFRDEDEAFAWLAEPTREVRAAANG